jgi:lipid II:glycine glycyltransferase (peptidoglycan interpeptide bridge formation enzyme)
MEYRVSTLDSSWDESWDSLAGANPYSGFMQSSSWMRFKSMEGYRPTRIGLFDSRNDLIGGAMFLQYAGPSQGGMVLCPEGPVLPWDDIEQSRACLKAIVGEARRLSEASGDIGLRVEPHLSPPRPSLLRNFTRAPVDLNPIHTLMLEITLPDETIRAKMHPKGRYNLGLSARHGVQVSRSNSIDDINAFYAIFEETAIRGRFFSEPYGFFLNLGAALFPVGRAQLYLAHWEGEMLASILVVFFGRRATYLYGGSRRVHRNVMPAYALHWAAIHDARERGCVEYDFYGYDPYGHPEHLYAGISRFKKQWGAARRDYIGAYDCVFYDSLAGRIIDRIKQFPEDGQP